LSRSGAGVGFGAMRDESLRDHEHALQLLAEELDRSVRPLFITGAGVSADSGLPTYRGVGGLYGEGMTEEGIPIEIALGGEMFKKRPEISWRYLWQILEAVRKARPNRAHEVMAAIGQRKPGTCVLTQNIDGFHRAAGSINVIEIHGTIRELMCTGCTFTTTPEAFFGVASKVQPVLPPRCPQCRGVVRPGVVLFEEALPMEALDQYMRLGDLCIPDLVVAVGTTGVFRYIQDPIVVARGAGVPTFEINPEPGALTGLVQTWIGARAAPAFERLWELMA